MRARTGAVHRLGIAALVVAALVTGPVPPAAGGDTAPRTFEGPGYSAAYPQPPTREQNQSKLWFHADAWWALFVEPTGRSVRVAELMPDHTWRPTSAVVNADVGDVGDALRDGDTVHVVTRTSDASLFYVNLSFDAAAREYRVGAPVLVTTRNSSSPATIAKDAAGALWVGYANATNVVATRSEDGGVTWGRVTTVATAGNPSGTAEVGALIAYDDRIGMLWSDQATGSFRFASHRAGDDPAVWVQEVAATGPNVADNHVSVGRIPGDAGDTLVAVVKTGFGDPLGNPAAGLVDLLVRAPGGQWSTVPVGGIDDGLNDPIVQVDLATRTLHVFARQENAIIQKTSSLDTFAFQPGIGSIFVNGTGHQLSNPTGTKDPLDARSGLVILASDRHSWTYRHAELSLGPPVADPGDQVPPSAPSYLRGNVVSPESVVLSWDVADDGNRWVPGGTGVPVAGYIVSRDGTEIATVTSTTFDDRARSASDARLDTTVQYAVVAVDAAGNRSAPVTLGVELPGSEQSRTPVLAAVGLLALAGLIAALYLAYRHVLARADRRPSPVEPAGDEVRIRTRVP
jgi:hypothetical protein